jgi:hypothetical protein
LNWIEKIVFIIEKKFQKNKGQTEKNKTIKNLIKERKIDLINLHPKKI